jgi:hypothetical protein
METLTVVGIAIGSFVFGMLEMFGILIWTANRYVKLW